MAQAEVDYKANYPDDQDGLLAELAKVPLRPAAGYLEGYHALVTAANVNEAIQSGKRIVLAPEMYELK